MHRLNVAQGGKDLATAKKILILLHGRGASAQDIIGLAEHLEVKDFAWLAPQATNNTWYPYSFLAPPDQNEPWLTSVLSVMDQVVEKVKQGGVTDQQIYFAGFSQGACLTLEFVTRNARRWGGVVAFTGGLIGDRVYTERYRGNFDGTPVFIGSSDPDPHVPVQRVQESSKILTSMGAIVTERIFKNMGHTVSLEEIQLANTAVFSLR